MTTKPQYDIVVIGAGIQGAGVAQAAAAYGYNTLVLEKFPEAGLGTSCKSSKLIHGGLRYLESGQFKLVRECLFERKILLKNAPKLVNLVPFYIPIYKHSTRAPWMVWLGLVIYSLFSFKRFHIIKKNEYSSLDGINLKNIKCIFKYYDAQTDDKKLTQAVIKSAQNLGAIVRYNASFIKSHTEKKQHILSYKENNKTLTTTCGCIINCSGPWVDSTQSSILPPLKKPSIELIAGTHIIVNVPLNKGIYYVEAEDKRAVFVMPWKTNQTLIGTTETYYTGNPSNVSPTNDEINYLLKTYNSYFKLQVLKKDIIESYSGLRVLPKSNDSVFNKSRESLIVSNSTLPGLITLIGGKLTAYRASSEETLKKAITILGKPNKKNALNTKDIKL